MWWTERFYTKYDCVDQYDDPTVLVEGALGKELYLYFVIIFIRIYLINYKIAIRKSIAKVLFH